MPIPSFTIDGVLPPYVGPDGPGGGAEDMTPYAVSALEVVATLGLTLRGVGFDRGFQWLDGSFVESKDPKDLDVVSFLYRPAGIHDRNDLARHLHANINIFGRAQVKAAFHLDAFPIDLDGSAEAVVSLTRYWLGLFSHRRGDDLWKGMLQVRLEDVADDTAALAALGPEPAAPGTAEGVIA
jgi:hypothetical protein